MTQTAQIQALLNQIDAALSKPNPRLPWMASGAAAQQRRVLERTRSYLVMLQQQLAGVNLAEANVNQPGRNSPIAPYAQTQPPAEAAQQVLQAVLQEMGYLRSNVMQPLRTDLEMLRQQRDGLQQEIRQLEAQRQQYGLPQAQTQQQQQMINDFLQALMARLQDNLTGQVTQMIGSLQTQAAQGRTLDAPSNTTLSPAQRLEQLQAIQSESDQLLLKLDSTLRVVFESLQNNVQSYQDSLSGGLEKMHVLGQQGEAMFAALVNRLAQQLGREASSYLQSSSSRDPLSLPGSDSLSPQPGASEEISDAQIDRFLSELGATPSVALPEKPVVPTTPANQDLPSLDRTRNTPASQPTAQPTQPQQDEEITLFQVDESVPAAVDRRDTQQDTQQDTQFQTDEEPTQIQPPLASPASTPTEIDEFYESLFGGTEAAPSAAAPQAAPSASTSIAPTISTAGTGAETALFEDALFAGVDSIEPAPTQPAPAQPASTLEGNPLSNQSTQSLENFLFGTEPMSPSEPLAVSQPSAPPVASSPAPPSPLPDVESIASLSDLVVDDPDQAPTVAAAQLPEPVSQSAADVATASPVQRSIGEESYVPAAPDENLLAPEEPEERSRLGLNLDPDMLQQLSVDLSNLEGREESDYPFMLDPSPIDDDDRTLSLEDNPPPAQPSTQASEAAPSPSESALPQNNPTAFDDLFADLSEPLSLEQSSQGNPLEQPLSSPSDPAPLFAASLDDLFPQELSPQESPTQQPSPQESPIQESIATVETSAAITATPLSTLSAFPEPNSLSDLDDLFTVAPDVTAASVTPEASTTSASSLTLEDFNIAPGSSETPDRPVPEDLFAALDAIPPVDSATAASVPPAIEPAAVTDVSSLNDLFAAEQPAEPQPSALPDPLTISPTPPDAASPPAETAPAMSEDLFPDDFNIPALPEAVPPETALTIEDFAQDVIPAQSQPEQTEDLFAAAELEDLFAEAETPSVESEISNDLPTDAALTPSLQEQSLLGELFFSDAANLPTSEALAPEEEGLTLDNFADYVTPAQDNQPLTATALPVQPEDFLEDLFSDDRTSLQSQPDPEPEAFVLEGFTEDAASAVDLDELEGLFATPPAETAAAELTFEDFTLGIPAESSPSPPQSAQEDLRFNDRPSEEAAFTLDGLDLLFEDLTDTPAAQPAESSEAASSESLEDFFADLDQTSADLDRTPLEETRRPNEQTVTPSDPEEPQKKKTVADELADWLSSPEESTPIAPTSPMAAGAEAQTADLLSELPLTDLLPDRDQVLMLETPAEILPPPLEQFEANAKVWYLGIDIGTTGISAVLLNRLTCELHPIYWSDTEKSFRLPTAVHLSPGGAAGTAIPIASLSAIGTQPSAAQDESFKPRLHDFKPYLKVGIPHYSPQSASWNPILQWSDQQEVPLSVLHQALQSLLATLSVQRTSTTGQLTCGAVGLEAERFQFVLRQLAQVIVGYPVNWSDTYSLNVREAVLSARLVAHPEQVCFIEDVIASLLSGLRSADGRSIVLPNGLAQKSQLHNADWQGGTLAISAGATTTELAFVNLPSDLDHLTYRDFVTRGLSYGGNAIDQDIICQLFRQPRRSDRRSNLLSGYSFGGSQTAKSSGGETWLDPDLEQSIWDAWDTIGWADLTLPLPGEPDPLNRQRLQQRLESSPLGERLLAAAAHLKLILQHPDQQGDQQWHLTRQELGSRVILPYIQRLNRELNTLLAQTGTSTEAINQVICTGGTASLRAITRWLRQKLPNATIIQDTYSRARASSPQDMRSMTCSRVAYGLAMLPLHPQVLDVARQQYSDYFLLLELLRAFPDQPLSAGSVMQLLERRGINTQACHLHILALLEGHLPPGLVPIEKDAYLLTPESRQNPDYTALLEAPLFHKRDNQTYEPNEQQRHRCLQYLSTLLASTHQTLSEPLTANFV